MRIFEKLRIKKEIKNVVKSHRKSSSNNWYYFFYKKWTAAKFSEAVRLIPYLI